jgi:membrane protease YdiL (CAAX protease family)
MSGQLLDRAYHFAPAAPWLHVLSEMSWRRWEFWLFTAVIGWVVAAFLEELFFRGYCQRRLAEDWGDGPAILGAACLFVFSRGPYVILDLYNLPSLVSLFLLAVGFGVVFAWTRSLVPSVVAHSIINLPMTPVWQVAALAVVLVGAALCSRRGVGIIRQVFARASVLWCLALAVVCVGYAHFSQGASAAVYVGASMLGLAVGLEAMHCDA